MRFLPTCALLLSLSAIPGLCQSNSAKTNTESVLPANANDASVDYAALRERLAEQNKVLTDQVNTQRTIVKKNQELLKEAQKLMEEKKKLETENVDLEKQRQALKASQSPMQTAQVSN
jgi:CII-binding regulator of phage lambda lysogenization HflD